MKRKNQKIERVLILLVCFVISFVPLITYVNGAKISDTITIPAASGHWLKGFKMKYEDPLEISIQVISGGIDLIICDSDNYPDLYYYEEMYTDITTTFSTTFEAPATDTWYIQLWNYESSPSQVSYTINHVQKGLTEYIIHLSIGLSFLAIILIVNFIGKK